MRRIVPILGLTSLLVLRVVLIAWAEERWVLWQEELRPSGEHRWSLVGTDPGERECEELKRHILVHMSREPEFRVKDGVITQTLPGGRIQSRLICLPQSVNAPVTATGELGFACQARVHPRLIFQQV